MFPMLILAVVPWVAGWLYLRSESLRLRYGIVTVLWLVLSVTALGV